MDPSFLLSLVLGAASVGGGVCWAADIAEDNVAILYVKRLRVDDGLRAINRQISSDGCVTCDA